MLIPFGVGVVVGIFAVAKLIEILLRRFPARPIAPSWACDGLCRSPF
ncbi:MAG: hypothetical protein ACLUHE_17685 [Christensenellales bacterium]